MQPTRFAHSRLDAYHVAKEALVRGDTLVKLLPRGYGPLADQLRRALLGAFTQTSEAAARTGADRAARFRCARAEAGESAACIEAAQALSLVPDAEAVAVIELLDRLSAMLTRLSRIP